MHNKRLLAHVDPMTRIFAFLAAAVVLGSCTTLSEDACRGGDWYSIGLTDGARGRLPDYLTNHAEACQKFGIAPDRATWERGRREGLKQYCTVENVYQQGRRNLSLAPVCPASQVEQLQAANFAGLSYRKIEREIEFAERKIFRLRQEAISLDPENTSGRADLLLDELRLRNQILQLRAELRNYDRPPRF